MKNSHITKDQALKYFSENMNQIFAKAASSYEYELNVHKLNKSYEMTSFSTIQESTIKAMEEEFNNLFEKMGLEIKLDKSNSNLIRLQNSALKQQNLSNLKPEQQKHIKQIIESGEKVAGEFDKLYKQFDKTCAGIKKSVEDKVENRISKKTDFLEPLLVACKGILTFLAVNIVARIAVGATLTVASPAVAALAVPAIILISAGAAFYLGTNVMKESFKNKNSYEQANLEEKNLADTLRTYANTLNKSANSITDFMNKHHQKIEETKAPGEFAAKELAKREAAANAKQEGPKAQKRSTSK